MKSLALLTLLGGALMVLTSGCADPGYTATEHNRLIARNWDYESKMMTDDWDHLLLLNPASRLTRWDVK